MNRRSLSLTALAGVLGAIGLTVLVSLSTDSEVVAISHPSHPVIPGAGWPAPRAPMPLPDAADPRELSLPIADPAPAPAEVEPTPDASGQVADLVRRLQEIEARRPLDFHHGAAGELQPFLSMEQDDEQRFAGLAEAVRILDEWTLSPRVRGAVLALAGAWGGQAEVLARTTDPDHAHGESWRSAMIGLLCADSRSGDPSDGSIELTEYLDKCTRDGVVLLPLTLGRLPDATVHALLFDVASRVVDDLEAWHSRNLAILALGTSIDERPDTLDLMTRLLFDMSPWGQQVRFPVTFVMAYARSDAAREVILEFLADPQTGEGGKPMVRWWMADRPAIPGELDVLTAPLRDPDASTYAKYGAVGSLLKRGSTAEPEEAAIIVGMLVDALDQETDQILRLSMVSALSGTPGGAARLRALEDSLRNSLNPVTRLVAARGLGTVPAEYRSEARAVLISARSGETKDNVMAAIEEALAALE
jgi:hypothetical protein